MMSHTFQTAILVFFTVIYIKNNNNWFIGYCSILQRFTTMADLNSIGTHSVCLSFIGFCVYSSRGRPIVYSDMY